MRHEIEQVVPPQIGHILHWFRQNWKVSDLLLWSIIFSQYVFTLYHVECAVDEFERRRNNVKRHGRRDTNESVQRRLSITNYTLSASSPLMLDRQPNLLPLSRHRSPMSASNPVSPNLRPAALPLLVPKSPGNSQRRLTSKSDPNSSQM
jgi:hypothetical protein